MSDDNTAMQVVHPNQAAIARQGFGTQELVRAVETATTAVAARAKAEVEAQHIIAQKCPRDLDVVRQQILRHCRRPRFAEAARYSKPVGNTKVEGPSIRFIEAALQAYGNTRVTPTISFEDEDKIIVSVVVLDLERNNVQSDEATISKTVERKFLKKGQQAISARVNSYGDTVYLVPATEDDIINKKNAATSKLIRNLGRRILPSDIVDEAMDACIETLKKADENDPDAARNRIVDSFYRLGVSAADLKEYLGHDLSKSTPSEIDELRAVYGGLSEGEAIWADALAFKRAQRGESSDEQTKKSPTKGMAGIHQRVEAQRAAQKNGGAAQPATPAPTPAPASTPATNPAAPAEPAKTKRAAGKGKDAKPAPAPAQQTLDEQPAPPAEPPPDEYIAGIKADLDRCIDEPHRIPSVEERVARLMPEDQEYFNKMLTVAKKAIEKRRAAEDVPS